jgi:hypothetical protein
MPSASLLVWRKKRNVALDEIESAHRSVGGRGPGRRYATEQINHAYAVLMSSQFQGFCRDLHDECVDSLVQPVTLARLQTAVRESLVRDRKLDRGNASSGNIGSDYNRLGIFFWDEVKAFDSRGPSRQSRLEDLNKWRNAIAHQDFDPSILGTAPLQLRRVKGWRSACDGLASSFDEVMRIHIQSVIGQSPW